MSTQNPTNGMDVLGQYKNTIFIRLPESVSAVIEWGCECPYCKAHPDIKPRWDTLCVPTNDPLAKHTWTVHMPDVYGDVAKHFKKK